MYIAVLGAGLTGLSAAFSLSYRFPNAQILLFDRSKRLGGWAKSEFVHVLGRRILLEGGPRTLKPNGAAILELVRNLGIEDQLITVPKDSPAAKKRYLYIPPGQVPGVSGLNVVGPNLQSPLMRKFLWPIMRAPLRFARLKDQDGKDESIHSFASRILGEEMAAAVGSAIIHGIYAADSRKISAYSTLPFWSPKTRNQVLSDTGSSIHSDVLQPTPNIGHLGEMLRNVSVYSFKDGNETLPRALEQHLQARSNVQIFRESPILGLSMRKDHTFELSYLTPHNGNHTVSSTVNPTHIVSALPLSALHGIIQPQLTKSLSPYPASQNVTLSPPSIPHLTTNSSSTVHVLNLIFPCPPCEIHPPGFGYLIPRPREGYPDQASDDQPGILGVVFDSCSTSQQDEPSMSTEEWYTQGPHTKITVMLGGPYPLYIPSTVPTSPPPSTHQLPNLPHQIQIILNHISSHLSPARPLPKPIFYRLWRNENCIPTYSIGHLERMKEMTEVLNGSVSEGGWGGRVEVVGAGVGGVSVPDCVLAGRNVGLKWL